MIKSLALDTLERACRAQGKSKEIGEREFFSVSEINILVRAADQDLGFKIIESKEPALSFPIDDILTLCRSIILSS